MKRALLHMHCTHWMVCQGLTSAQAVAVMLLLHCLCPASP